MVILPCVVCENPDHLESIKLGRSSKLTDPRFKDFWRVPSGIRPKREMGISQAQTARSSFDAAGSLSSHRIRQHADWYEDRAYWHYSKSALDAGVLDVELRAILRKEVLPEHVEIEFERVMKAVFASR